MNECTALLASIKEAVQQGQTETALLHIATLESKLQQNDSISATPFANITREELSQVNSGRTGMITPYSPNDNDLTLYVRRPA